MKYEFECRGMSRLIPFSSIPGPPGFHCAEKIIVFKGVIHHWKKILD